MCQACFPQAAKPTRRSLGMAALALLGGGALPQRPTTARANGAADALVEPRLHLADAPADRLVVALTLDACPGAFDDRLAQSLVDNRIPATIFVTGAWMRRNPAGLAFLLANRDLLALENHGERHVPAVLGGRRVYGIAGAGTLDAVRKEVTDGARSIAAATGATPRWYRGATGLYSPETIPEIERLGFAIAGYSLNADMGASLPAHTVAARIAGAASGDVIVGHINQPSRPSGLGIAAGVTELRRRGAVFVHLDPPGPATGAGPAPA
jgi:peptidoglycan/xylan/chitin deacetylase (PgdA/CDA1 family)